MKRAIVTGASGSIGGSIGARLAADGYYTILHVNSNKEEGLRVLESIQREGGSGEVVSFNVANLEEVRDAMKGILEGGPVQVVVNNAGIHRDATMAGMDEESWQSVLDVSLNGFFYVTRELLMPMIKTRWGRIINISSIAGITGNRGQTNYSAAKSGLHGATKSLALELASRNITVNAVAPGIIESPMIEGAFDEKMIQSLVPMKRAGKPEEVASLVSYLASEESAYITGQVISINGGMI